MGQEAGHWGTRGPREQRKPQAGLTPSMIRMSSAPIPLMLLCASTALYATLSAVLPAPPLWSQESQSAGFPGGSQTRLC